MPVLINQVSVPANAVNANVFAGSIWELPDRHYWGRLALTGDAGFFLRCTVQVGQRTHLEESQISGAARVPILPDDIVLTRFACPKGQRIILKVRNTDVGAHVLFWNLHLDPA